MVENPRQYMPLGTGYFTENSRWVSPKSERKKGYPAGSQKNNNNNNKFIQYYHFVQMLAIKMTISKTAKFKEMKIWWNGRINYVKCLKGEILAASLAVWERESIQVLSDRRCWRWRLGGLPEGQEDNVYRNNTCLLVS